MANGFSVIAQQICDLKKEVVKKLCDLFLPYEDDCGCDISKIGFENKSQIYTEGMGDGIWDTKVYSPVPEGKQGFNYGVGLTNVPAGSTFFWELSGDNVSYSALSSLPGNPKGDEICVNQETAGNVGVTAALPDERDLEPYLRCTVRTKCNDIVQITLQGTNTYTGDNVGQWYNDTHNPIFTEVSRQVLQVGTTKKVLGTIGCYDEDILSCLRDLKVAIAGNTPIDYSAQFATMIGLLGDIDENTDGIEAQLTSILTAINGLDSDDDATALASILTAIQNVLAELVQIRADTNNIQTLLAILNNSLISEGNQTQALLTQILNKQCTDTDTPLGMVSGVDVVVPAGLKSVTIHATVGDININGNFCVEEGCSMSFGTQRGNCINEILPAISITGVDASSEWKWIGLR